MLAPPVLSPVPGNDDVVAALLWSWGNTAFVAGVQSDGTPYNDHPIALLSYGSKGELKQGAQGQVTETSQAAWFMSDETTGEITVYLVGDDTLWMQRVALSSRKVTAPVPLMAGVSAVYMPQQSQGKSADAVCWSSRSPAS